MTYILILFAAFVGLGFYVYYEGSKRDAEDAKIDENKEIEKSVKRTTIKKGKHHGHKN